MEECPECRQIGGFHKPRCSKYDERQDRIFTTVEKKLDVTRFHKSFKVEHNQAFDIDYNQVRHLFETDILTEHLASDFYYGSADFKYPATTWQMYKMTHADSWWLGWLVRRRPVRWQEQYQTVKIKVDRYLKYPEATIEFKQLGHPIPYETVQEI